jgi:hypothetical protein
MQARLSLVIPGCGVPVHSLCFYIWIGREGAFAGIDTFVMICSCLTLPDALFD